MSIAIAPGIPLRYEHGSSIPRPREDCMTDIGFVVAPGAGVMLRGVLLAAPGVPGPI